ncbi:lytic transglycosylase domain-containing protein [Ideonella sp. 4Y16]|uniref:Lytic transglycosylase domain-containing protein n=1 Tax=Ideonella alba TaxID=2824118 RepID=A0A940YC30_9BURK|nr:lytic transglycosylase domain-containing protein [Ideonella alba]MBQ0942576.1 lytic transglycosylase domain-containing protein [Ideonella alba]
MGPLAASAQTPLYGYVDGHGVAHLAQQPLDTRFEPLLRERGDSRVRVPGKSIDRGSLLTWLEFAPEVKSLMPLMRQAAESSGLDVELLKAVIAVESGFRADQVSPAGAIGLMQLMPAAGERYATRGERAAAPVETLLRDPRHNLTIGSRMLADLWRRTGSIDAALAAWNAGEGRVRKAGNRVPDIAETRAHVHLVLELYWSLLQSSQSQRARSLRFASGSSVAHPE